MKLLLPTNNNLLTQGAANFFKSQKLFHQFSLLSENISYNVSTENAVLIKLCLLHDIFLYSPQLTSRKYIDFVGGGEITKYL